MGGSLIGDGRLPRMRHCTQNVVAWVALVALLASAGTCSDGALPGTSCDLLSPCLAPVAIRESAWLLGRGMLPAQACTRGVLQLRGGRVKEEARFQEQNEALALEYMATLQSKGKSVSLDLNDPDGDDEATTFGVPQQVEDEENEAKRKSMMYPRSIHWGLTKRTALVIQLGDEHWKKVNTVRVQHDTAFDQWMMPVIKLTSVFFTKEKLWEAAEMVQQCIRQIPPFNISFTSIRAVQHASQTHLWLEPDHDSRERILHVRSELMKRFPTLRDKVQFGEDGKLPHIRLGCFDDLRSAERQVQVLKPQLFSKTATNEHETEF
jgi:hypothetical protein